MQCFVCPSDTKREYGICRELDSVQAKLVSLEPYARPYFADVRQRVQPAVDVVRPYVEQARPYYNRIDGFVRPQATRAATIYRTQVVPKVLNAQARSQKATKPYVDAARAQFHRTFDPSIDWYTQAITQAYSKSDMPKHVATAKSQVALLQARLEHLRSWLPSMWHKLLAKQRHQPYYKMYERHWPWVKARYHDTAVPTVQRTYAQSKTVYFSHVRPQAITLWQLIQVSDPVFSFLILNADAHAVALPPPCHASAFALVLALCGAPGRQDQREDLRVPCEAHQGRNDGGGRRGCQADCAGARRRRL